MEEGQGPRTGESMQRKKLFNIFALVLTTEFLAVSGSWLADSTNSVMGRHPLVVLVVFVVGLAASIVYHYNFDQTQATFSSSSSSGSATIGSTSVLQSMVSQQRLVELGVLLVLALTVGAIASVLPITSDIIDGFSSPFLRTGWTPPFRLIFIIVILWTLFGFWMDSDDQFFLALLVLALVTSFAVRPAFGAEADFKGLARDAIDDDGEIRWLQGGVNTSVVYQDHFVNHGSFHWAATDPVRRIQAPSYRRLVATT